MKKVIFAIAILFTLSACNNTQKEEVVLTQVDTTLVDSTCFEVCVDSIK